MRYMSMRHTHETHANEVHAHEIHACEMHAHEGFCEDLARQSTVCGGPEGEPAKVAT
jgi:hypothetical protein